MTVPAVTVGGLLHSRPDAPGLPLELLSGEAGLERPIGSPHIQKTGLALAGFDEYLQPDRVLVFGESEVRFLESQGVEQRLNTLAAAFSHDIPCVVITGGWDPPVELIAASDRYHVPLLRTPVPTPMAIAKLSAALDDLLAARQVIHGVLMDILGLGVLVVGESGIGKSECALDLVVRGHRLVADDTVEVRRRGETVILGTCPELTRHHMEVRGLGIINIRDLFGVASTRTSKRVELVVQLERWDPPPRSYGETSPKPQATAGPPSPGRVAVRPDEPALAGRSAFADRPGAVAPGPEAAADPSREYDRLGLDERFYDLLGLRVPLIRMPVAPGRSLAILVEVAARNQLLRSRGRHAARDLVTRLEKTMKHDEEDGDADKDVERGGHV